jgi:hypothetical protein
MKVAANNRTIRQIRATEEREVICVFTYDINAERIYHFPMPARALRADNADGLMSILRESLKSLSEPLTSLFTIVLIVAASAAQVVSLSSVYPILQSLMPDQNAAGAGAAFARPLDGWRAWFS